MIGRLLLAPMICLAQSNAVDPFVSVRASTIALEHVRVIDGTGAPVKADQTIVISGSRIASMGNSGEVPIPTSAQRMDLRGRTAIPGIVGMHDHLFFAGDLFHAAERLAHDMPISYPRLYLASGVTTIRTTGSFEPYTDLEIKKAIDAGLQPGPKMNVTGPYLEGEGYPLFQLHKLTGADDVRRTVDYWANEGVGSFKVYTDITRSDLKAAITAAHRHGLTVTGHLCSIGFREAAEIGIDGVEHGLFVDTEFDPHKKPDECPDESNATAAGLDVGGAEVQRLIQVLVKHRVAVTSTLPAWEEYYLVPRAESTREYARTRPEMPQRVLDVLSDEVRKVCEAGRGLDIEAAKNGPASPKGATFQRYALMLEKEMEFERAYVRAGGLLLAGPDGVSCGDIAGFGDQREIELLVEAGFSAVEAIQIATLNGARFLKQAEHIGSLAPGKQADIAIVNGDPAKNVQAIENVELVFKDGVGYDSKKLIESVRGQVGIR